MNLSPNKEIVIRFNKEVIEQGNVDSLYEILDEEFINHTPPPNMRNDREGILFNLIHVLRPAFSELRVEIYDQLEEGNKVTTRKSIFGVHTGEIMGVSPTLKKIKIDVIDIVHLRNNKYLEHWGINTLSNVLAELKKG